jgi:hypothetical protein
MTNTFNLSSTNYGRNDHIQNWKNIFNHTNLRWNFWTIVDQQNSSLV